MAAKGLLAQVGGTFTGPAQTIRYKKYKERNTEISAWANMLSAQQNYWN
jgi:hypothetical protein